MKEKSVVYVTYGEEEDPAWDGCWIIPFNLYKKYLDPEALDKVFANVNTIDVSAGFNKMYYDRLGIVIKAFLEELEYSLVLFGDEKMIVPNSRLVESKI